MHRPDTPGTGAGGVFVAGNPSIGVPATIVGAAWMNAVLEELIALLAAAGISPDKAVNTQVRDAVLALIETNARSIAGSRLTVAAPAAVTAGDPVLVGGTFGIAVANAAMGAPVALDILGTFALAKATGDSFTAGGPAWWDPGAAEVKDADGSGRKLIGAFAATVGSGPTSIDVRLAGLPGAPTP